jgi:hypothetical protein
MRSVSNTLQTVLCAVPQGEEPLSVNPEMISFHEHVLPGFFMILSKTPALEAKRKVVEEVSDAAHRAVVEVSLGASQHDEEISEHQQKESFFSCHFSPRNQHVMKLKQVPY